jgi:hypothetical protein
MSFYLANSSDIKKYWGYRQIHHWQMPCVLASGAPGDEFMLRSPTTANQYLLKSWHQYSRTTATLS